MKVYLFRDISGKDLGIVMGWIGGILLVGGGLWFFTQSIRTGILQRTVNQMLVDRGCSQQLESFVPSSAFSQKRILLGTWYTLRNSESQALVFSMMAQGIFFPCVAVVSSSGKVDEIIPLNGYSEQTLKRLPQGIIKIYIQRIERGELGRVQKEDI